MVESNTPLVSVTSWSRMGDLTCDWSVGMCVCLFRRDSHPGSPTKWDSWVWIVIVGRLVHRILSREYVRYHSNTVQHELHWRPSCSQVNYHPWYLDVCVCVCVWVRPQSARKLLVSSDLSWRAGDETGGITVLYHYLIIGSERRHMTSTASTQSGTVVNGRYGGVWKWTGKSRPLSFS